jgi:hypothetical protein
VAALARQARDREGDHQPGEAEDDDVEPGRRAVVVAERFRQVGEGPDLELMDQLEEAPRGQRDDEADDPREDEQDEQCFGLRLGNG